MTDLQQQLSELENQMRLLIQIRNERRRSAEIAIKRADVEFDRDALPLGRKINRLRDQLEDEAKPAAPSEPRERKPKHVSHDPEWSQEEIDHFYELQRR